MIYLDNSATTKPCAAAVDAMREMLEEAWHNPSALYREAIHAQKKVDACRDAIAGCAGMKQADALFTGGGTEADSLAILGSAERFRGSSRVILFAAEHAAVLKTAEQLIKMGHKVDFAPAGDGGVLDLDALQTLLAPDVALLSCMHVNNETGAVQPLAEIAQMLRERSPDAVFHVDGVQGFLRVSPAPPGIDLYAVSAHKVHGPKGVGALLCGPRARLSARIAGGGQERGLRSGTENTAGIAAFAAACEWIRGQADAPERLRAIKLRLYQRLSEGVSGLRVNGPPPGSPLAAPHILNVSLPGIGGEVLLHALEAEGVLVGTGSACSSKRKGMSAAFQAMRAPVWAADSAIRLSIGMMNTLPEADEAADAILRCYARYGAFQRK